MHQDWIIYDCLSEGVHTLVGKPENTQRLLNIANDLDENIEDDDKRQESFQNIFHPPHGDRMSPEHKVSGPEFILEAAQVTNPYLV